MEELKILLDRVYELEGLIHLALSRNDDASDRIASLISAKGDAVRRALEAFESSSLSGEQKNFSNPLEEAEELESYSLEEESLENGASEESSSSSDDAKIGESAEFEEAADSDLPLPVGEEPLPTSGGDDAGMITETEKPSDEMKDSENEPSEKEERAKSGSRQLRTLFSINDRFRFSRELFGGSTRRFDDSMAYLDGAIDFNEVEDFFISEQKMDPDSPVVQEFLEILSRSFAD